MRQLLLILNKSVQHNEGVVLEPACALHLFAKIGLVFPVVRILLCGIQQLGFQLFRVQLRRQFAVFPAKLLP